MSNSYFNVVRISAAAMRYGIRTMLLCSLLLCAADVYADADFWATNGANLKVSKDGGATYEVSGTGYDQGSSVVYDLGQVQSLSIKGYWVKTWKDKNAGNVCGAKLVYHVDNGAEAREWNTSWETLEDNGSQVKQKIYNDGLDIDLVSLVSGRSGKHVLYFKWVATFNKSYDAGCNDSVIYKGDNTYSDQYFALTFSIKSDPVVRIAEDADNKTETAVDLHMYLARTGCNSIQIYGFDYGPSSSTCGGYPKSIEKDMAADIPIGTYSLSLEGLEAGTTYYYRPYVMIDDGSGTPVKVCSSEEGTFRTAMKVIYWNGTVDSDWDNRANWVGSDGTSLTCTDAFSPDLKVVIPAPNSTAYPVPAGGIQNYPVLPASFDAASRPYKLLDEQVEAGFGSKDATPTMYAKSIDIEYGGAFPGAANLTSGELRYTDARYTFDADRSEWILVGTVVKPFENGESGATRNIISGDFFIANHEPHVYMHQATVEAGPTVTWNTPFAGLDVEVPADQVFAIRIPDQYGYYKFPASFYYRNNDAMKGDATVPRSFSFTGRFVNDNGMPSYTGLAAGTPVLLNNTYPASIDAKKLNDAQGTVYTYVYKADKTSGSFQPATAGSYIKPMQGFVIIPTGSSVDITSDMVSTSENTRYKAEEVVLPYVGVAATKLGTTSGSEVRVVYDEADGSANDAVKIYSGSRLDVPEVFALMRDTALSIVNIDDKSTAIPLGLVIKDSCAVSFSKTSSSDMETVVLEDRLTGLTYDLNNQTAEIAGLSKGRYEGRFYLNLKGIDDNGGDNGDGGYTSVDETDRDASVVDIFAVGRKVTVSASDDVELKEVYVVDMSGRTMKYSVSGHYVEIELPVVPGVYVVRATGDIATGERKVVIK